MFHTIILVRNVDGSIIQFCYGEDGVDVHKSNFLNKFEELAANRKAVLDRFGSYSGDSLLLQSNYITNLPKTLTDNAKKFVSSQKKEKLRKEEERKLQKEEEGKLSKKEKLQREKFLRLMRKPGRYDIEIEELTKLLNVKYRASLIEPGEAVGVILAQSLGEPSTQMTLNTFHLAGRGDMNVTLGMPRIQEILMKASANISTPYMECPLHENITKGDAERLAAKLRGVRLADVVAGTEVCTVHFHNSNGHVSNLYKLQLKLHSPEDYPDQSELTADECQTALRTVFIDAMEYAIEKHLNLLHKVSGIQETRVQDTDSSLPEGPEEPESRSIDREELVASDGDDENEDDMGADAEKWKQQQNDELEYDDSGNTDVMDSDPEEETKYKPDNEDDPAESGGESEVEDEGHMSDSGNKSGKLEDGPAAGKLKKEKSETVENLEQKQEQTTQKRSKKVKRAVHVESTDLKFEVHYLLHKEPTILLAQIAQKTLKSLFVSGSHNRNIGGCKAVWVEKEGDPSPKMLALRTAGVDFEVFWALQDILKIQDVKSNDIHAILKTYGVEAARATIIHEVNAVFQPFGIDVNKRHLSLVADFMTSGGSYRPMSILGMAQFCTSPFGKMSFEQATRFISEAAFYGEVDTLDGPSASVSLGKPAKMGTGCFGLLQNMCFVEPPKM